MVAELGIRPPLLYRWARGSARPSIPQWEGSRIPATAEEKPTYVEYGEEIVWVNRNPKDGSLWLNAKPRASRKGGRGRSKKAE